LLILVLAGLAQAQSIIGTVPITNGNPHGLAADPTLNLVYVAVGTAKQIAVVDGASSAIVRTISVGPDAMDVEGIAVDPLANRLYAGYSRPLVVIDAATGEQVGQINESIYGSNEIAINPYNRKIYLADWSSLIGVPDRVLIYDAATLSKIGQLDLGVDPSFQRVGVAVNTASGMAYATYTASGSVVFIDGQSNSIVRTVQLEERAQDCVAVNPATNRVYVKCLRNVVVLDGSSGEKVAVIPGYWENIVVNPATNRIYLALNNKFRVVDGVTNAIVGSLALPYYKVYGGVACLPALGRVYVAFEYNHEVAVIQDVTPQPKVVCLPLVVKP